MEISLYPLGYGALGTFGVGAMTAVFHGSGTTPSASDLLKRKASGAAKNGVLNRREACQDFVWLGYSLANRQQPASANTAIHVGHNSPQEQFPEKLYAALLDQQTLESPCLR